MGYQMKNWDKKRVVVTGAAGFLGSHLCESLVSKGTEIIALDNLMIGSIANLEPIRNKIQIISCDITKDDLQAFIKDSHVVFHLAALASPRMCKNNFDLAFDINIRGTKNVLSACTGQELVIFMSAAPVYGDPLYVPIDEKHPLNGKDPYSITKIVGEYLCHSYYQNYGVPIVIVRNFNVFGPRQVPEYLIPTLITQALSKNKIEIWSSQPHRDFMFVDNTIDAWLKISENPELIGDIVNVGSGIEIQIGDLAKRISEMMAGTPVIDLNKEVIGSMRSVCNNEKLKQKTGWMPKISLEEGLRKTIEWYKAHSFEEMHSGSHLEELGNGI